MKRVDKNSHVFPLPLACLRQNNSEGEGEEMEEAESNLLLPQLVAEYVFFFFSFLSFLSAVARNQFRHESGAASQRISSDTE